MGKTVSKRKTSSKKETNGLNYQSINPMMVHVTQDHIDRGRKNVAESCAIALALKDKFEENFNVVGAHIISNEKGTAFHGPRRIDNFIERFDNGEKVKPFSFVLRKVSGKDG